MGIKVAFLDGKPVAYTDETEFLVEIGRNRSAYKIRWRFVGDLHQAVRYYRGLNVGRGYKKRLRAPSFNKPVLARQAS